MNKQMSLFNDDIIGGNMSNTKSAMVEVDPDILKEEICRVAKSIGCTQGKISVAITGNESSLFNFSRKGIIREDQLDKLESFYGIKKSSVMKHGAMPQVEDTGGTSDRLIEVMEQLIEEVKSVVAELKAIRLSCPADDGKSSALEGK